jgi:succinate-acetate transporter protein
VVTTSTMLASLAQSLLLTVTLGTLAAGSALTAAGFYGGTLGVLHAGGWLFVISAVAAWLVATAMMLEHSFGRTIIPLGKYTKAANLPGARATAPIQRPVGMPGVRVGQ